MSSIVLKTVSELMPQVRRVFKRVEAQLRTLLPEADIEHIGATAMPNAVTKGDIDVLVRVPQAALQGTIDVLRLHFSIKQPENWTPNFASFGDDSGYELPLGIQLVVRNSDADSFIFLRDYFILSPDALTEYNRLKLRHAADGAEAYWSAKNSFFSKILASRQG